MLTRYALLLATVACCLQLHFVNASQNVCSADSECGKNEVCVFTKLANGGQCKKGVCKCKPCYGRQNVTTVECSPVKLIKPCDASCSLSECSANCSTARQNEVYPPDSECVPDRASWATGGYGVKCGKCYKPFQGRCVIRKSPKQPMLLRGAKCRKDACICNSTLTCVGKCGCPVGKYWNSTQRRCTSRKIGDSCLQDNDCVNLANSACINGRCSCSDGFTAVPTSYLNSSQLVGVVTVTKCHPTSRPTGVKVGELCATGNENQPVGVCETNSVCFRCPSNSTLPAESKCRTVVITASSTLKNNCPPITAANLLAVNNNKRHKIGKLCKNSAQDCGPNEVCSFDSVQPPCQFGYCRCQSCYQLFDTDSSCQPISELSWGDSCLGSINEKYPIGTVCSSDSSKVICDKGFVQNGSQCQRQVVVTIEPGETCKFNSDCNVVGGDLLPSNLMMECNMSAPTCDCYGLNKKWNPYTNSCMKTDDDRSCFHCPEDDESANCREVAFEQNTTAYDACFSAEEKTSPPKCNNVSLSFKECLNDANCGQNETCTLIKPCSKKVCRCKPCFASDLSGKCSAVVRLKVGNFCSEASNELLDDSMICRGNTVQCRECRSASKDGGCSWSPKSTRPGQPCSNNCDCAANLHCQSSTCQCPSPLDMFRQQEGACFVRNYGDPCSRDQECQRGGRLGKGYTTTKGGRCSPTTNTCTCSDGFIAVETGFYYGASFSQRTICVLNSVDTSKLNVTSGNDCVLDPIANAEDIASVFSRGGICSRELACLKCPHDDDALTTNGNNEFFGKCSKLDTDLSYNKC